MQRVAPSDGLSAEVRGRTLFVVRCHSSRLVVVEVNGDESIVDDCKFIVFDVENFYFVFGEFVVVLSRLTDEEVTNFLGCFDCFMRVVRVYRVEPFVRVLLRVELTDVDWCFLSFEGRDERGVVVVMCG